MRSEHRAPLVASIVVVLACIGVMAHAVRTDALGGIARRTPMGFIAGAVLQPKPEVGVEAPQPRADAPLVPAGAGTAKAPAHAPSKAPKHAVKDARPTKAAHIEVQSAADAQATEPEPTLAPTTPDAVVSTSPATPTRGFTHSHSYSPNPTPTSPATPYPSTPASSGRGHGWGQSLGHGLSQGLSSGRGYGSDSSSGHSLGNSIASAIASSLAGREDKGYDQGYNQGHNQGHGKGYGSYGGHRGGGYDNDRSDDHRGYGHGGHRSWR